MFDPSALDLDAYFERVRYAGSTNPTLSTLAALAVAQPAAIPFENLDPYLRRPVSLAIADVQRKLVSGGRGGWCFEQNLLFGSMLSALGFSPIGLAARVLWNAPEGTLGARSHMVLVVELEGRPYLVDAGFGGLTLTAPLRLEVDLEQPTPHERFRLRRPDEDYVLEAEVAGVWKALYRFDLQPQRLPDYEVSNWYLCTHPGSHFLSTIIAARSVPDRRHTLRGGELHTYRAGRATARVMTTVAELRHALQEIFGIGVPAGPAVDAALSRVFTAGDATAEPRASVPREPSPATFHPDAALTPRPISGS